MWRPQEYGEVDGCGGLLGGTTLDGRWNCRRIGRDVGGGVEGLEQLHASESHTVTKRSLQAESRTLGKLYRYVTSRSSHLAHRSTVFLLSIRAHINALFIRRTSTDTWKHALSGKTPASRSMAEEVRSKTPVTFLVSFINLRTYMLSAHCSDKQTQEVLRERRAITRLPVRR